MLTNYSVSQVGTTCRTMRMGENGIPALEEAETIQRIYKLNL